MELLLHKGLGQFCEVADQWQLSGCICYTQLQALLSFQNINPSWNKAAHLLFRPKSRVDHVLESKSWSHYYHYQCSPVPPPQQSQMKPSQQYCLPHQFQQTAHHARYTKLQPVCMLWGNTVSPILLCSWLPIDPTPSHLCTSTFTLQLNATAKVSFTLFIVDSLKKNLPNIVLVKLDCSTV